MSSSGKGTEEPPTDFNDCVSKIEPRAVLDDKLNEILQQITNLAGAVDDVEQRRPEPHYEDEEEELQDEDDGDVEAEAEARRADARNHD
jgi:hypothetical protein